MLACAQWLADDYLVRQGYMLAENGPDGDRFAIRNAESFPIDPACSHPDCPPLTTQVLESVS
jgi:hypothetical protein